MRAAYYKLHRVSSISGAKTMREVETVMISDHVVKSLDIHGQRVFH